MHDPTLVVVHADRIGSGNAFIGLLSDPTMTAKAAIGSDRIGSVPGEDV
jgi:hypothetical protein